MYCFGPFLVGAIIGARTPAQLLDWRVGLFAFFFLFPANFFIYGINDIHDYETDALNLKKTGYESLLAPAQQFSLRRQIAGWTLPFIATALVCANWKACAALAAFVFFSYFYSAPPIRAKIRPGLDSAFNVLYICPAFFAYFLLGGQQLFWPAILAAWCWVMAMHAYSAVPDISADQQAGIQTIATKLGLTHTLGLCLSLYLVSAILSSTSLTWLSLVLGALYSAMMIASLQAGSQSQVLRIYKFFPALNTLSGFALFWRIAWEKFL